MMQEYQPSRALALCGWLALFMLAAAAPLAAQFNYYIPAVLNDQLNDSADGQLLESWLLLVNPTASTVTFNYELYAFDGTKIRTGDCTFEGPFQIGPFGTALGTNFPLDDDPFLMPSKPVCLLGGKCTWDHPEYACSNRAGPSEPVCPTCPNKASVVISSDGPLTGHLYTSTEGAAASSGVLVVPGLTLEIQASTSTRLRLPHLALDGRDPSCNPAAQGTRWPVLFLQNPSSVQAAGCIRVRDRLGAEVETLRTPFSIGANTTYAWEVGAVIGSAPCRTVRYSIDVDTTDDCGSGTGGSVVGALYTFNGPDWDVGNGMNLPVFVEIPVQLGNALAGQSAGQDGPARLDPRIRVGGRRLP